jgi:phage terminase large subunit-like protein
MPDWLSSLIALPEGRRGEVIARLTPEQAEAIAYDWAVWGRPDQQPPPGDWRTWLVKAGRGWGKTRVGAEWVRLTHKTVGRIALVAPTAADARDVMVEGESGILAVSPASERPTYEPSKRRLTWANGAIATTYSADEPDRLRGPQHGAAWCDEVAAWKYPAAWDMLMFGLRLGSDPRCLATTTPKSVPLMRAIAADPHTIVTRGRTYDNAANLAEAFLAAIVRKYEGTRLGRQELDGEDLEDNPGALWQRARIDELRVVKAPELVRVVVAVDPAATSGEDSDETGIVTQGRGVDEHGYVLADDSLRGTPDAWGRAAVRAYHLHRADRIVAEANQGGEMVAHVIHTVDPNVPVTLVHASRGKQTRAEPVSALYEQGRYHHVGCFAHLEDQMCQWEPGLASPDRMDALVWGGHELMLGGKELNFA